MALPRSIHIITIEGGNALFSVSAALTRTLKVNTSVLRKDAEKVKVETSGDHSRRTTAVISVKVQSVGSSDEGIRPKFQEAVTTKYWCRVGHVVEVLALLPGRTHPKEAKRLCRLRQFAAQQHAITQQEKAQKWV